MKKLLIFSLVLGMMLATASIVVAGNQTEGEGVSLEKHKNVNVPNDPESASFTKYHGKGIWSTTHLMRKDNIKPDVAAKKVSLKGPKCNKIMGVSWADTPDYVAEDQALLDIVGISIGTWDAATGFDLLGTGEIDAFAGLSDIRDYKNSYSSGNYPVSGVIAVCQTWWNSNGEIIEYDIMFDTDFSWGDATVDSDVMDLQNIATHEIGHAFGLLDVYQKKCGEVTMFGYSYEGDIAKRTLEAPDIFGIQTIYGS